ncbi:MAG: ComF family protein [Alphaproteobacteria bacterium]|nr:ComF family protein [Alphaproteobacteria bacterium]
MKTAGGLASGFVRQGFRASVDFLLPPLCLACEQPVTQHQTLCADCWKGLHFVGEPFCTCCGAPFGLPVEAGALCGACLHQRPVFNQARSVLIYDDASRPFILKLKHGDRLHPVSALAKWMVRAGHDLWGSCDVIVPVPLHRWRLLKRRYNQAALLAQAVGAQVQRPVAVDALVRVRATASQGHMNRAERYKNVEAAFVVAAPSKVKGKRIVLIDDVLTSGATVESCARILLEAGALMVNVVSLARTKSAT